LLNLDPEILLNSKPYSSCKSTSLHWNWWGNRVSRQWGIEFQTAHQFYIEWFSISAV